MGAEFLVNSYAGQWQEHPDIARLNDGSIVVVWDSFYSEGDTDYYYVAAQRYSATGQRIGGEMLLDNDITGQSRNPSVVALEDGGFAVAWEASQGSSILDETDVYTRAFNADGSARGASIVAHGSSTEDQYAASIAATANGGYTLTFSSYGGSEVDVWDDIFMQRFSAQGTKLGGTTQVNQHTEMDQHNSRATTLANGNVLITWEAEYAGNENPSGVNDDAVRGRIYSQTGQALTREFLVVGENDGMNSGIGLTDSSVDVAALPNGQFIVSWYQTVLHDDADTTYEIHAQRYNANGVRVGTEMLVYSTTEGVPDHSAITALDGGGFVIAWDGFGSETYEFEEVYARVYDAAGRPLGAHFKVNPPSGETGQENPELQALDGGGFMVVYGSEYLDGDNDAIAGRIFGQGSDRDDTDTLAWSGSYHALAGHDTVVGTNGNDIIHGDDGNDRLTGNGGNDRLYGSRGNEVMAGGAGNDLMAGGRGGDILNGGTGADTFLYFLASDSDRVLTDRIVNFEYGRDEIDLSAIDANTAAGGNQAFAFVGAAAFSGVAGQLRYAGGQLSGDTDGDRVADLLITISNAGSFVAGDLIL